MRLCKEQNKNKQIKKKHFEFFLRGKKYNSIKNEKNRYINLNETLK